MRWPWQRRYEVKFEDVLRRLIASQSGSLAATVTPETCMRSPTVQAIVTAVSRRMSVTPVHVFQKTTEGGLDAKNRLDSHPISRLLRRPNDWQTPTDFWQDATSVLLRWGRFHAFKARAATGRVRQLIPLASGSVVPQQDEDFNVTYEYGGQRGEKQVFGVNDLLNVRGPARDFVTGDSPIEDIRTDIALEIMASKFGANFFKNGALPLLLFAFTEGSAGFETKEQEKEFLRDIDNAIGGENQLKSLLVPKGIEKPSTLPMDHDKAQMIETRKYQRTVIAGAFGVPPHLVGDLERGTFNNVEQQDKDFTQNVVMPIAKAFESAMERDLLTIQERFDNYCIRFNLDSTLRASFKDRQEGLRVQREMGIINANEWREIEGRNPRTDEEGDDYLHPGNMIVDGEEPDEAPTFGTPEDQETEQPRI